MNTNENYETYQNAFIAFCEAPDQTHLVLQAQRYKTRTDLYDAYLKIPAETTFSKTPVQLIYECAAYDEPMPDTYSFMGVWHDGTLYTNQYTCDHELSDLYTEYGMSSEKRTPLLEKAADMLRARYKSKIEKEAAFGYPSLPEYQGADIIPMEAINAYANGLSGVSVMPIEKMLSSPLSDVLHSSLPCDLAVDAELWADYVAMQLVADPEGKLYSALLREDMLNRAFEKFSQNPKPEMHMRRKIVLAIAEKKRVNAIIEIGGEQFSLQIPTRNLRTGYLWPNDMFPTEVRKKLETAVRNRYKNSKDKYSMNKFNDEDIVSLSYRGKVIYERGE